MSELRYNQIVGDWAIIATDRAKRPQDFVKAKKDIKVLPEYKADCPFCPGNETLSPDEIFRLGTPSTWKTRVVPNKFPALSPKTPLSRCNDDMHNCMNGFGIHEVLLENPKHNTLMPLMTDDEMKDIIETYVSRYNSIKKVKDIEAIIIFKNYGPGAGTSLEHPHSQIVATPIVPRQIRERVDNAMRYFDVAGRCLFCHMMEDELSRKERIVLETDKFVSFIPYAAQVPFNIWTFPRRHMADFSEINPEEIADLAKNLKAILRKLYYGLDNPDFNLTIRSIPVNENGREYFHWYLGIVPRLTQPAGFELGSGMFINVARPEESAEFLRKVNC